MANLKYYDSGSEEWETLVIGKQGPTGPTGPAGNDGALSPNAIINGAFDIWQRGTSFSHTASLIYGADRWGVFRAGFAAGANSSRQASGLESFQWANRIQRVSGNTSTALIVATQPVESVNSIPFAGKTVTISFWARRGANFSSASNLLSASVQTGTGTDQNPWSGFTGQTASINENKELGLSWQQFFATGSMPSSMTQLAIDFRYTPTGTAGADDWFEVTGVQLEAGPVASPFRRNANSLQGELAACQRYYYRTGGTTAFEYHGVGSAGTTTQARMMLIPKQTMRVGPTSIEFGNLGLYDSNSTLAVTTCTLDQSATNLVAVVASVASGLTQFRPYSLISNNNTSGFVALSAEL